MRIKNRQDEDRACALAAQLIAAELGIELTYVGKPDEGERRLRAVDKHFSSVLGDFWFEHTRVESFADQLHEADKFNKLIIPLEIELTQLLAPTVSVDVVVEVGFIKLLTANCDTSRWLKETIIKTVSGWQTGNSPAARQSVVIDIPRAESQLFIRQSKRHPNNPCVCFKRARPRGADEQLRQSVAKRLAEKLPKLELASVGSHSVLVLQITQIMTSLSELRKAYTLALAARRAGGNSWEPSWLVFVHLIGDDHQLAAIMKTPDGPRKMSEVHEVPFTTDSELYGVRG